MFIICVEQIDTLRNKCISVDISYPLWYLYRARNKITQLSIPTYTQLHRHRLKFIKNHLKSPACFGLRPSAGSYNVLAKITIILTAVGCFYAKSGDVAACRVVCIGLYLKSV